MKFFIKQKTTSLLLVILIVAHCSIQGQTKYETTLEQTLLNCLNEKQLPCISAAALLPNGTIWKEAIGQSHPSENINTQMLMGIGSNTKLFTAVLCLKLVEQGTLSLDDSISKWLPPIKNIDSKITLEQLLQHQSGIDDYTNKSFFPQITFEQPDKKWIPSEILNKIGKPIDKPGTTIAYSNTNYILAGMILEKVTGKKYHELLKELIFKPLNLTHTYVEGYEDIPSNFAHPWGMGRDLHDIERTAIGTLSWAAGCIVSNPNDMVQWYNAIFNTNFLSPSSKEALTYFVPWKEANVAVGLGIFKINHESNTYWAHGGQTIGYNSFFIMNPQNGTIVTVIMNDAFANAEIVGQQLIHTITSMPSNISK